MLTTGTHDTKRGEDVRARLNVLSEIPDEWEAAVRRWQELNADARVELDGAPVPDANEEYLIYQTLVGTWPLVPLERAGWQEYVDRIVEYLDKALCEAKLHTSWLNPYEEYDLARGRLHPHDPGQSRRRRSRRHGCLRAFDCRCRIRQFAGPNAGQDVARRACPTSIRALNSGISIWSTPTIADRWISPSDARALAELQRRAGRRPAGTLAARAAGRVARPAAQDVADLADA